MVISNKYKNTLNDLINSSNKKFVNWPKLIDKKSYNIRSKKNSIGFLEKICCLKNKNVFNILLELGLKT